MAPKLVIGTTPQCEERPLCLGDTEQQLYNPLATNEVPNRAHLEVEIEFPAKTAGAEPIKRKYLLKERC